MIISMLNQEHEHNYDYSCTVKSLTKNRLVNWKKNASKCVGRWKKTFSMCFVVVVYAVLNAILVLHLLFLLLFLCGVHPSELKTFYAKIAFCCCCWCLYRISICVSTALRNHHHHHRHHYRQQQWEFLFSYANQRVNIIYGRIEFV